MVLFSLIGSIRSGLAVVLYRFGLFATASYGSFILINKQEPQHCMAMSDLFLQKQECTLGRTGNLIPHRDTRGRGGVVVTNSWVLVIGLGRQYARHFGLF